MWFSRATAIVESSLYECELRVEKSVGRGKTQVRSCTLSDASACKKSDRGMGLLLWPLAAAFCAQMSRGPALVVPDPGGALFVQTAGWARELERGEREGED